MTPPRQRGWLEIRLRQARNPPPPVLRAVLANLAVASIGGVLLLVYELAIARGASLPGGDLRTPLVAIYVAVVVLSGSLLTYLWVELPGGAHGRRRRSGWAAMLGLFAALPICYLALVVIFQILRPLIG
ncbi:MAG: hypothetical protein M3432_00515 [Chloroflexota bacterium]|nr:hypothetical protein [Chloroflexota bacterium]